MSDFIPFELERWQGVWENQVSHNLAESGVHPMTAAELMEITDTDPADLHQVRLGYSPTSGSDELRSAVAGLYPGAAVNNVLITVGSAEANFSTAWTLSGPGKRIAVQTPVYKQMWGVARNLGADVVEFGLKPDDDWALDFDEAASAITRETDCIVVTSPNNPTGHAFSDSEKKHVADLATQANAWLVVDEVYRGAELSGEETPSWWGSTDRTIVTGGLSKAYGLPGLRIGWVVAPEDFIQEVVKRHDYSVIGPAGMSDFLGIRAIGARDRILERTRHVIKSNYEVLNSWGKGHSGILSWTPPDAGAIVFARYQFSMESDDLAEYFRSDVDTLLVPGSHFDRPGYIRIGFGEDPAELAQALEAASVGFEKLTTD
jgi:aspartate/methionine/tyrosine aminotransferase